MTAAQPTIPNGTTQQYTATGEYSDGTNVDLTGVAVWSSSDATIASINATGLAKGNAQGGPIDITASYDGKTGTSPLEITAATVTEVKLSPTSVSIAKGTTTQVTATAIFSDTSTLNVSSSATWSSSDATTASVDTSGLVKGNAQGAGVTITATYGGKSGTTSITVTAAVLTSVTVTPGTVAIARFTQQQFTATANFSDNSTQNVTSSATWSSSSNAVASIDTAGKATANSSGGPVTITATYGVQSGTADITVNTAVLTAIQVSPVMPSLGTGVSQQFTATGIYDDGSTEDLTNDASLTWTSSDTGKATISNSAGTKGVATTVAAGTTIIKATKSSISGQTTLTVTPATLTHISISAPVSSVANGRYVQFTATGVYSDNSTQDLTDQVLWASSSDTVASISNTAGSKGLAHALSVGSTNITATKGAITSANYALTVTNATLLSMSLTPTDPVAYVIAYGTTQQFRVIGTFSDTTTLDLTNQVDWTSSSSVVATIDANGLATTSTTAGTSLISAKFPAGGPYTMTESTNLEVRTISLTSISISPANGSIIRGQSVQYYATGHYADGTVMDLTDQVLWSSDTTGVASVSNASGSKGMVTGIAAGTGVTITATRGGVTGSTTVDVAATDTTKPTMSLAQLQPGNTVLVTFSKPMDYTRAMTASYYKVMLSTSVTGQCSDNSNFTGTGLTISSVSFVSQTQYVLNLGSGTSNALYTVIGDKANLRDVAGNTMDCNNYYEFLGNDTVKPYLVSVINPDQTHVTVNFSEPMTTGGGVNAADNQNYYTLSPAVTVSSVTALSSSSFRLNLASALASSTTYTVTVATNVTDAASPANAMGSPNALTFVSGEGLKVVSAVATDTTHVKITFNKAVSTATSQCTDAASCAALYKLFPVGDLGNVTAAVRGSGNYANEVTLTHVTPQLGNAYTVVVANGRNGDQFDNGATRIESEASTSDYVEANPFDRATFIGKGTTIITIDQGPIYSDPFADLTSFNFAFTYSGKVYLGPNQRNENAFRFDPNGYNSVLTTFWFSKYCDPPTNSIPIKGFGYIVGGVTTSPVCGTNSGPNSEVGLVGFNSASVTVSSTPYEFLVAGPLKNGVDYIYYTQDVDTQLDWKEAAVVGTNGVNSKSIQTIYATDGYLFIGISSDHNTNKPVFNRYNLTAPGGVVALGTPDNLNGNTITLIGKQNGNPAGNNDVVGIDSIVRFGSNLYLANNGGVVRMASYDGTPSYTNATPSGYTETTKYMPASNTTNGGGLGKVSPGKKGVPFMVPYNNRLYLARNVADGSSDPFNKTAKRGELWVCTPSGGVCGTGDWQQIISGTETDLPANTKSISLLQANGSGVLYVGFDGTSGSSIWRIASTTPSATSGTMASAGWTKQGATGLGSGLTELLSSTSATDGTYNYLYLTAGNGSSAIRVFKQRD